MRFTGPSFSAGLADSGAPPRQIHHGMSSSCAALEDDSFRKSRATTIADASRAPGVPGNWRCNGQGGSGHPKERTTVELRAAEAFDRQKGEGIPLGEVPSS